MIKKLFLCLLLQSIVFALEIPKNTLEFRMCQEKTPYLEVSEIHTFSNQLEFEKFMLKRELLLIDKGRFNKNGINYPYKYKVVIGKPLNAPLRYFGYAYVFEMDTFRMYTIWRYK